MGRWRGLRKKRHGSHLGRKRLRFQKIVHFLVAIKPSVQLVEGLVGTVPSIDLDASSLVARAKKVSLLIKLDAGDSVVIDEVVFMKAMLRHVVVLITRPPVDAQVVPPLQHAVFFSVRRPVDAHVVPLGELVSSGRVEAHRRAPRTEAQLVEASHVRWMWHTFVS